jgi:hypothetical protein
VTLRPLAIASASANAPAAASLSPLQWLSFATIFGPAVYALLIVYAILHGAVAAAFGPALYLALFTVVWSAAWALRRRVPRTAGFVRFMLPILMYGVFYVSVHTMLAATGHPLVDARLAAIDRALFGVDPIAWLGAHGHPPLTDLLYVCYVSYYLGMPVLLVLMWRGNAEKDFRMVLSAMVMGWYGVLMSYAVFPALGPERFFSGALPALRGWLPTTPAIQSLLHANLVPAVRDCVPSMHTAITLLTLVYAYRFQRRFFLAYVLPGIGVIVATMYIQQHYVIDVLLGVVAFGILYGLTSYFTPQ